MKWDKLLSKGFLIFLLIFLVFAIGALSTPLWLLKVFTIDGCNGPRGDAIGGVATPFITLIMALLAFLAFWMQYQTLKDQRLEINCHHFEDRLSLMLEQQRENINNLRAGTKKGREATEELAGELYLIYSRVSEIFDNNLSDDIKSINNIDDAYRAKLTLYYNDIKSDNSRKQKFMMKTAYGIFFQGKNFLPNVSGNDERVMLTKLVKQQLDREAFTIKTDKHYSEILFNNSRYLSDVNEVPYPPCQGHNAELGCYYRHLYQIICLISCYPSSDMAELEKYSYAKLVRSHLSDYEQLLLYYNSLSDFGEPWNVPLCSDNKYAPINMGLIARFRMVKNLPGNINWRGINPLDQYKKEINEWKKLKCDFFETPHFFTIDENPSS